MIKIVLFVVLVLAGVDKPAVHQEQMPTAKDCSDAVADLIQRAPTDFGGHQVTRVLAGCVIIRDDKQAKETQ